MKRILTWASLALALIACERGESTAAGPEPGPTASEPDLAALDGDSHATLSASQAVRGASLYDLEMSLTDQDSRPLGLDVFDGKPVLITMFYGSCPYACPLLISDIKRVLAELPPDARREARVLLVSFDPERDTPVKLKQLARAHGVDQAAWRFTRADAEQVRELAAVLGIKYRKLASGAINHSSVITLLDRQGRVRERLELGQPRQDFVQALSKVAARQPQG